MVVVALHVIKVVQDFLKQLLYVLASLRRHFEIVDFEISCHLLALLSGNLPV